jgi:SAM-dependent methyltransferase
VSDHAPTRKADFSAAYVRPDPRELVAALRPLEYQVPRLARPVVERELAGRTGRPVLDVCCSYGINAAGLRCGVDAADLAARYDDPALAALDPAALTAADAAFFADRLVAPDVTVLGLDASAPAVDYARGAGLLADGWAEDLESAPPSAALAAGVADVGTVVCTGGVGYVGERTFSRLLDLLDPTDVRLVLVVLRVFDLSAIVDVLAGHGLVTEKLPGTLRQRRFADAAEQQAAEHDVRARGLDPAGKESDGWFHAECFVSRPRSVRAPAR